MSDTEIDQLVAGVKPIEPDDPVPQFMRRVIIDTPDLRATGINPRLAMVVALSLLGVNNREIAERLGLNIRTVRNYLSEARRLGRLENPDVVALLRDRAKPLAAENLIEFLESDDAEIRAKFTIETLRGTGEFMQHGKQQVQGAAGVGGGTGLTLTLKIEQVSGDRPLKTIDAIAGEVVGVPRQLAAPQSQEPNDALG